MAFGDFTHPSKTAVFDHQLEVVKAYFPNRATMPLSELWVRAKSQATGLYSIHRTFARALRALIPGESYGPFLDFWLRFHGLPDKAGGVGRIQAAGSSRAASTNVTSTGNETLNSAEELADTNGLLYQVTGGPYTFVGVETKAVDIAAIDTGLATNLLIDEVLTFQNAPANIEDDATLILDFKGGRDRESDDAGRARLIDHTQAPSLSGNDVQWKRWIEEISEADVVGYIWNSRQNGIIGAIDYAAVYRGLSGAARLIESDTDIEAAVELAISDNAPNNQVLDSRRVQLQTEFIAATIDISYTLDPDAAASSKVDWDSNLNKPRLVTYTAGGPTVLVNIDIDVELPIIAAGVDTNGKRYHILMNGEEKLIQTYTPASNKRLLTLESAFTTAPVFDNVVMAGGGLAKLAWDAHQKYVDGIGPDRTALYGSTTVRWDDTYRIVLARAAIDNIHIDVLDVTITTPAANVVPTELLTAFANILVVPAATHIHQVFI